MGVEKLTVPFILPLSFSKSESSQTLLKLSGLHDLQRKLFPEATAVGIQEYSVASWITGFRFIRINESCFLQIFILQSIDLVIQKAQLLISFNQM